MKTQLSDELYPIIDLTAKEPIEHVGGQKNFPVYLHDDESKYVFMPKHITEQFSEVAFSKVAKQMGVRAADNNFAVRGTKNAGVASKLFLEKDEDIFGYYFESQCDHLLPRGVTAPILQNANISMLQELCKRSFTPLHPDFCKNLIESYLFSVLCSNYDHLARFFLRGYRINNFCFTKGSSGYNVAPYHDMGRTFLLPKSREGFERFRAILCGYKDNIPNLRTEHKDIHDRFLDNLGSVDVKRLSDFNRPHLIQQIADGDAGFTEQLSGKLGKRLTKQIKFMKNYRSCRQEL